MELFVSWSGDRSNTVADELRTRLEYLLPSVSFWKSDDIPGGVLWPQALMDKLDSLVAGILCLTPENVGSPWLNYEAGVLLKSVNKSRLFIYLFDMSNEDLEGSPLQFFQSRQATEEGTRKLVEDINRLQAEPIKEKTLKYNFELWWPKLAERLEAIRCKTEGIREVEGARVRMNQAISSGVTSVPVSENQYLRRIVCEAIHEFSRRFDEEDLAVNGFPLPHVLYPAYLVKLLRAFDAPPVKAVALVDTEETFWPHQQGREILRNTSKNSMRVFVFVTEAHMRTHLRTITSHTKYEVRAISYERLTKVFPHPHDFSIIGDINSTSILAYYDETDPLRKEIRFSNRADRISYFYDLFLRIRDAAIPIEEDLALERDGDLLIKRVFKPAEKNPHLTELERRPVEMSSYIQIHDYDEHEEKHAYFLQMMQRMLQICTERNQNASEPVAILEMGAGTGIFTRRLIGLGNVRITALEIDWACYHVLLSRMRSMQEVDAAMTVVERSVPYTDSYDPYSEQSGSKAPTAVFQFPQLNVLATCINADSRIYNPGGTFHLILSSFADHHIKTLDKPRYFKNIKDNLRPGGILVVGDEFLPHYDESDPSSREQALHRYHEHIIEETRKNFGVEAEPFVLLEEAALHSGLKGAGDFKVSCEVYERFLAEAGFVLESKQKMGPHSRDDVGGIYVYVLSLPSGSGG